MLSQPINKKIQTYPTAVSLIPSFKFPISPIKQYPIFFIIFVISSYLISSIQSQPTNSDSCYTYNNNLTVCQQCIDGFYLNYFFCSPCAPLCLCTSRNDYCQKCMSVSIKDGLLQIGAYMVDKQQPYCKLCSEVIQNCIECQSSQQCTKCMNGRYVLEDKTCSGSNNTCGINCEVCANNISCQLCSTGYYLIATSKNISICSSQTCIQNCVICETIDTCSLCNPYYYQQNGKCFQCPTNCTVCNDSDTCTVCTPGTYFINGTCQFVNSPNCIRIAGGFYNPTCLVCQPGYYNGQGSCTQCSGCQLCSTQFICYSECLTGYKKFNYACLQSSQGNLMLKSIGMLAIFIILGFI